MHGKLIIFHILLFHRPQSEREHYRSSTLKPKGRTQQH